MYLTVVLALVALLFAPAAWAVDATSVTYSAAPYAPGFCLHNQTEACTIDATCTNTTTDYCVVGWCTGDGTTVCDADGDCAGPGGTCEIDITFEISCHATGVAGTACDTGDYVTGEKWVNKDGKPSGKVWLVSPPTPPHWTGCETGESGDCRNGFDINGLDEQSFDNRGGYVGQQFVRSTPATYPLDITPASSDPEDALSIVKSVSGQQLDKPTTCIDDSKSCMTHYAVLTIEGSAPPANAFRPPANGSPKPATHWVQGDVDETKVAWLDATAVSHPYTIAGVGRPGGRYNPITRDWPADSMRGKANAVFLELDTTPTSATDMNTYHAMIANWRFMRILRLSMDDTDFSGTPADRQALHNTLNECLDIYWTAVRSPRDLTNGPKKEGKTAMVAFCAQVFDDATMKAAVQSGDNNYGTISSIVQETAVTSAPNSAIWMGESRCSLTDYRSMMETPGSTANSWCADPFGYLDQHYIKGNDPTGWASTFVDSYQQCCGTRGYAGFGIIAKILGTWFAEGQKVFAYYDRWEGSDGSGHTGGYWGSGDPCNDPDEGGGVWGTDWGHDTTAGDDIDDSDGTACWHTGTCTCITGGTSTNRSKIHEYKPDLFWGTTYLDDMWTAFNACASDRSCVGIPASAGEGGSIQGISISQNEGD